MISSRDLNDLNPVLAAKAITFRAMCQNAGIDVIISCTYRDNAAQAALYAKGRTAPGGVVTNAEPGQSAHNVTGMKGQPASMAFDCVPIVHGKCVWDAADPVWERIGQIGESLGLEWAGRWVHFKEYPHFQLPGFHPKPVLN